MKRWLLGLLAGPIILLTGCGQSVDHSSGDNGDANPHGHIPYLTVQCVGHVQYGTTDGGDRILTAVLDEKDCP